jgi:spore germination protein GerM
MRDSQSTPSSNLPNAEQRRSLPVGLLAGLAAVALVSGGSVAWWTLSNSAPTQSGTTAVSPAVQPEISPSVIAPAGQTVQVYWLKSTDNKIELAPSPVTITMDEPSDLFILQGALARILQQPSDASLSSAIPAGTQIRNLAVKEDGIHIDLSSEFTTGGGSTSMMGRLGQVVYTATTIDPKAQVWISIEGEPLDVLGGEGLMVDQPMTRDRFENDFQL